MDIALIDPQTGVIENVIVCDCVADAEFQYPHMDCVERTNQPFEPGAKWDGKTVTRAATPEPVKDEMALRIEKLEAEIAAMKGAVRG